MDASDHPTPSVRAVAQHVMRDWFVRPILPSAPWVFGATGVAFVVVPTLVGSLPGIPTLFAAGVTAGLTLGVSATLQPLVKRPAVSHPRRVIAAGLLTGVVGMVLATGAALRPHPLWLPVVALALGATHGLVVVGCMTLVELSTPQHLLAPATASAYSLTYLGFTSPFVVSVLALSIDMWLVLGMGAVISGVTAVWVALDDRRDGRAVAALAPRQLSADANSGKQVPELLSRRHRVDDQLVAALEHQDHGLK